jgi:uncharacterized protein (DUF885 family)
MIARRMLPPLLTLVLGTLGCRHDAPPVPPEPTPTPQPRAPKLNTTVETIFSQWFEAHPVTATALGEHTQDARWPDLSPAGIERDHQRIVQALTWLDEIDAKALTVGEAIDVDILRTSLQLQRFEHEVERPQKVDPLWYAQLVGAGLEELVSRNYAPVEQRADALTARLVALPALLNQASANLEPALAKQPHAEVAIEQLEGVVVLLRTVIPERLASASAAEDVRARVGGASAAAIGAIREFQTDLRTRVLPVAAGDWRLGPENFERKLALTLHTDLSASELRRVAVVEHGRIRKRMAQFAHELADIVFEPSRLRRIKQRAGGDVDAVVIRAVLDELAANHTEPDDLRDAIEANMARLIAFVEEKNIVTMDPAEVLEVIWTPPHQRGVYIAGLAPPGPLDAGKPGLPSFYLVQPVPPHWPEPTRESFLREYNNFMLEILSIHEAVPGHFVQLYYGKREPSKVRRVLHNGPFVEGWAVYAEKVMVDEGYAGTGPDEDQRPRGISRGLWQVMTEPELRAKAIALHGLKFYLRTVANAILDHAVHTDAMSREAALELLVELSFQQEGEAVGKWIRAQVTSTQLSTYFVGAQAWLRLRKKAEARARDANQPFDMAAFHDEALSHGAPPVHALPRLMGWDDAESAEN